MKKQTKQKMKYVAFAIIILLVVLGIISSFNYISEYNKNLICCHYNIYDADEYKLMLNESCNSANLIPAPSYSPWVDVPVRVQLVNPVIEVVDNSKCK